LASSAGILMYRLDSDVSLQCRRFDEGQFCAIAAAAGSEFEGNAFQLTLRRAVRLHWEHRGPIEKQPLALENFHVRG
jgi:hypothetical protein